MYTLIVLQSSRFAKLSSSRKVENISHAFGLNVSVTFLLSPGAANELRGLSTVSHDLECGFVEYNLYFARSELDRYNTAYQQLARIRPSIHYAEFPADIILADILLSKVDFVAVRVLGGRAATQLERRRQWRRLHKLA